MPYEKKECEFCKKQFVGKSFKSESTRFCSLLCWNKCKTNPLLEKKCRTCGVTFFIKTYKNKGVFCSVKCIRYQPDKKPLSKKINSGFWVTATEEQKFEKMKFFFEHLVIRSDKCWSWKNSTDRMGYASIYMGPGKRILGHRASWLIYKGDIPNGMFVCHHCDNPECTNPEHLFIGTPKDNTQDCLKKQRRNAARGEKHYYAKLTQDQVIEIRRLSQLKYSQSKLAKMFEVSPSGIQGVIERKTWKHVP